MLKPVELIIKKRSGKELSKREIDFMVDSYIDDSIADYQMAAFLMAIYFQGMNKQEIRYLTDSYIKSGRTITFPESLRTVDKHSTGGVGDKISIVLAPLVAACGGIIPMISGRGLGHTGGTLDKLESIQGFRTNYNESEFRRIIEKVGFSIISQSSELVPADRKIYALRDVTATVESLPLITASIISKKIAEGAQNLVIDLKVGTGAFIKDMKTAKELGLLLKTTGETLGQKVEVIFSNMNSPLGNYIGNALEIRESIQYLSGKEIPDIDELTMHLAQKMLLLSGVETDPDKAIESLRSAISNGSALDRFARFIKSQGGDDRVCEDLGLLPVSKYELPIKALSEGWVDTILCEDIGYSLLNVNAGRKNLNSKIDHSTGAFLKTKVGDYVEKGEEIGMVYCNDKDDGLVTVSEIARAHLIVENEVSPESVIL